MHLFSFYQGNMIVYLSNWFENTVQFFLCQHQNHSKGYHAWYKEGGKGHVRWYACKRKWQWEYIAVWVFYQDQPTVLVVVPCGNRANMIPPFRIPKVVCRQITHWAKRKGLLQNHLTKITNNTISFWK